MACLFIDVLLIIFLRSILKLQILNVLLRLSFRVDLCLILLAGVLDIIIIIIGVEHLPIVFIWRRFGYSLSHFFLHFKQIQPTILHLFAILLTHGI